MDTLIDIFEKHFNEITQYHNDLKEFGKYMKIPELDRNKKIFYLVKLNFLAQEIKKHCSISEDVPKIEDLFLEGFIETYYTQLEIEIQQNKQSSFQFIIDDTYGYAKSQIQILKDEQTKEQLCLLDGLIKEVIIFMTNKMTNNESRSKNMDANIVTELQNFLYESVSFHSTHLQKQCQHEDLRIFLITFFSKTYQEKIYKSTKEIDLFNPIHNQNIKSFLEIIADENSYYERSILIKRDSMLLFIDKTILSFNVQKFSEIINIIDIEYSPFVLWAVLQDIPDFIKKQKEQKKLFKEKKWEIIESSQPLDDYKVLVGLKIYEIYTHMRLSSKKLPKLGDQKQDEILRILKEILLFLKIHNLTTIKNNEKLEQMQKSMNIQMEPIFQMKFDLIHIIREYLRIHFDIEYSVEEILDDFDLVITQEEKLGEMEFKLEIYQYPNEIEDYFKNNKDKKKVDELLGLIRKFQTKKPVKIFEGIDKDKEKKGQSFLLDDDLDVIPIKEIQTYLIQITFLCGKLQYNSKDSSKVQILFDEIMIPIIEQIKVIDSHTKLASYVASLVPLIGKDKAKIEEVFSEYKEVPHFKEIIEIIQLNQPVIKRRLTKELEIIIFGKMIIGNGLINIIGGQKKSNLTTLISSFNKNILNIGNKDQITNLVLRDFCLLYDGIQAKSVSSKNQDFLNLIEKNQQFLKACEQLKGKRTKTSDLIENFHDYLLAVRFFNLFKLFDDFEVKTDSDYKSRNLQKEAKKYLIDNFYIIYQLTLHFRLTLKKYDSPIENFILKIKNCLVITMDRTHKDLKKKECPFEVSHYNNLYAMLMYVRISDNTKDDQKSLSYINSIENDNTISRNNTTMAHFLLTYSPVDQITGEKLCASQSESQLCHEHLLISKIMETEGEHLDIILEHFKNFKQKQLVLFNVLMSLKYMYNVQFERVINQFQEEQRHENAVELQSWMNLKQKDMDWASDWLKLNFSNTDNIYNDLRESVNQEYQKNTVQNYLVSTVTFELHQHLETGRLMHFDRILVFVHFAIDKNNYQKLFDLTYQQFWIYLILKSNQSLLDDEKIAQIHDTIKEKEGKTYYEKFETYWLERMKEYNESSQGLKLNDDFEDYEDHNFEQEIYKNIEAQTLEDIFELYHISISYFPGDTPEVIFDRLVSKIHNDGIDVVLKKEDYIPQIEDMIKDLKLI